jgi:photosystem II stability/assembly factor-like uncharacterized protein
VSSAARLPFDSIAGAWQWGLWLFPFGLLVDSSVIYASGAHLHRSSDRGATWTHQPDTRYCAKLAVDVVSDTLYCSGSTVFRSTDGGAHWTVADDRIHPDSDSALVATPSGVFAGSDTFLYRSRDGGRSWDPVAVGRATAVTYVPLLPNQVYVATDRGIAVSEDGGARFGDPTGPKDVVGLAADPFDFRVAYAASRTGVFVSRNSGASWEFASTGIDAHAIRSVALAPGAAQTMLASFHGALMRTVNGGTSWSVVAPEPRFADRAGFAGFDPKVAGRAYACGDSFAISVDSGASFTPIADPRLVGCTRILFHGATMTVGSLGQIYKSTNGGETWAMAGTVADFGITSDLAFGDALGTVVLAAHGNGVFRSTDGGDTFTQLSDQVFGSQLIADPTSPTHVVAASCGTLQRSNDGGASFERAISGPCVQALTVVGSAFVAVGFASFPGTRAVMSTDGGATWKPFDIAGVPRGAGIDTIATSDDGKTIYLGTTAGLYRSVRP